jgi:uncharacterized membrane protein
LKSYILNTLDDIRSSYWFIPLVMAIIAAALSYVGIRVDTAIGDTAPDWLGWLFDNQPEGARAVLSTVAGSMVTVGGVVFSITLVSVSNAAFQFGPRLLTTFMRDRSNQITLGTFTATFLYCLLVLRAVQSAPADASDEMASEFVPHIALLGAIALAICSIGVLIYFIHHVPQSIHVSRLVAGIGGELCSQLDERFPTPLGEGSKTSDRGALEEKLSDGRAIRVKKSGYIRIIDGDSLIALATKYDLMIELLCLPGGFITSGDAAMRVVGLEAHEDCDAIEDELRAVVALGAMRTPMQDAGFLAEELSEIALRALSPGVNDPHTAITAMHWMGAALTLLGEREDLSSVRRDENDAPRVLAPVDGFDNLMRASLWRVLPFAARNVTAGEQLVAMTEHLRARLGEERRKQLDDLMECFFEIARESITAEEVKYLMAKAKTCREKAPERV